MRLISVVAPLLMLAVTNVTADNLLLNGDFENASQWNVSAGDAGWVAYGDILRESWAGHNSTSGVAFAAWNIGSYGGFVQKVDITTNMLFENYTFSLDLFAEEGFGVSSAGSVTLSVLFYNGSDQTFGYIAKDVYPELDQQRGMWVNKSLQFTVHNSPATALLVGVEVSGYDSSPSNLCALLADNACLQLSNEEPADLSLGDSDLYKEFSCGIMVSYDGAVSSEAVEVSLSASPEGRVDLPATITIPAGTNSYTIPVFCNAIGTIMITASSENMNPQTRSYTIDESYMTLSGPESLPAGTTGTWIIERHGPSDSSINVEVMGVSEDGPLIVPMGVGQTSAEFEYRQDQATTTHIRVSCDPYAADLIVTFTEVDTDNMLLNGDFENAAQWNVSSGGIGWIAYGDILRESWAAHNSTSGVAFAAWNTGSYGGFVQRVGITSNMLFESYVFSIELFAEEGFRISNESTVSLSVRFVNDNDQTLGYVTKNVYPELDQQRGNWVSSSLQFTITNTSAAALMVGVDVSSYDSIASNACALMGDNACLQEGDEELPNLLLGDASFYRGFSNSIQVSYSGAVSSEAVEVSLSASPEGRVDLPATITIPAGTNSYTIPVFCNATGTIMITASSESMISQTWGYTINNSYLTLSGPEQLPAGTTGTWVVERHGPSDFPVNIELIDVSNDGLNPGYIYIPMAAGQTRAEFEHRQDQATTKHFQARCQFYSSVDLVVSFTGAEAGNLLLNGDFENAAQWNVTGGGAGWIAYGDILRESWAAHNSTSGVAFAAWNTGSYGGFVQKVGITSNMLFENFAFSIDLLAEEGFRVSDQSAVSLFIRYINDNNESLGYVTKDVYPELDLQRGTWVCKTLQFTVTNTAATALMVGVDVSYYDCILSNACALMADNACLQATDEELVSLSLGNSTFYRGFSNNIMLSYDGEVKSNAVNISFSSSPEGCVYLPDTITIPAGTNYCSVPVYCNATGTVSITASNENMISQTREYTVNESCLTLSGPEQLSAGITGTWTVERHGPSDFPVTAEVKNLSESSIYVPMAMGQTRATFEYLQDKAATKQMQVRCEPYAGVDLTVLFTGADDDNLLLNGGFENPAQWGTVCGNEGWYAYGNISRQSWAAHNSSNGICFEGWIDGGYGGFVQRVGIASNVMSDYVVFSIDMYAEDGFYVSDQGAVDLCIRFVDAADQTISQENHNVYDEIVLHRGAWVRHTFQVEITSTNAVAMLVGVDVSNYSAPGGGACALFVDNASLEENNGELSTISLGDVDFYRGMSNVVEVTYDGAVKENAVEIDLSASPQGCAVIPVSVTIPAGTNRCNVPVYCVTTGTLFITAASDGMVQKTESYVIQEPHLTLSGPAQVPVGVPASWVIERHGPSDFSVFIEISDSTVTGQFAYVEMAAGQTSAAFEHWSDVAGEKQIQVSCYPYTSADMMVTFTQWELEVVGQKDIPYGMTAEYRLVRTGPLNDELVVGISNNTSHLIELPGSVTIPAGTNDVSFTIEAFGPGLASYSLVPPGGYQSITEQVTITLNRLSNGGFEDKDDAGSGPGCSWSLFGEAGIENWYACAGSNSLVFYAWNIGLYGGAYQFVDLGSNDVGNVYTYSMDFLPEDAFGTDAGVFLTINFMDGETILGNYTKNIYADLSKHRGEWRQHSVTCTNTYAGATRVMCSVYCDNYSYTYAGSCALFADNAELTVVDPNEPRVIIEGPSTMYVNSTNEWTFSCGGIQTNDRNVSLVVHPEGRLNIPETVTIPGGSQSVTICVEAQSTGMADVQCFAQGMQSTTKKVQVIPMKFTVDDTCAYIGVTSLVEVATEAPVPYDMVISVLNDTNSAVAVAHNGFLAAGETSTYIPVIGLQAGVVSLTVAANGTPAKTFEVTVKEMLLRCTLSGSLYEGTDAICTLTRQGPVLEQPLQVDLSAISINEIIRVPSSIQFAAGCVETSFVISALSAGSFPLSFSAALYPSLTETITVLYPELELDPNMNASVGRPTEVRLSRLGRIQDSVLISLASTEDHIILSSNLWMNAGCSETSFVIQASAAGDAIITASAVGFSSASGMVTATHNLLIDPGFESADSWGEDWYHFGEIGRYPWAGANDSYGICMHTWIDGAYGGFYQSVPVSQGENSIYAFSVEAKPDVDFVATDTNVMLAMEFLSQGTVVDRKTSGIFATGIPAHGNWKRYSLIADTTNNAVDEVRVVVYGDSYRTEGGYCAIMFDNAILEKHSNTNQVLILQGSPSELVGSVNVWSITRTGPIDDSITVHISSSDSSAVSVEADIVIPAGVRTVYFAVYVNAPPQLATRNHANGLSLMEEPLADDSVMLVASATGYESAEQVIKTELPALSFIGSRKVAKGNAVTYKISRSVAQAKSAVVSLSLNNDSIAVPASVVIPAGQQTATFTVEGMAVGSVVLTASAEEFENVDCEIMVIDYDPQAQAAYAASTGYKLNWLGQAGIQYIVEQAYALDGNWHEIYSVVAQDNGAMNWTDTFSSQVQSKYYRISAVSTNESTGSVYDPGVQ